MSQGIVRKIAENEKVDCCLGCLGIKVWWGQLRAYGFSRGVVSWIGVSSSQVTNHSTFLSILSLPIYFLKAIHVV